MEHLCSRCGAAVDDNSAFCPACEAPQITYLPRESEDSPIRLQAAAVPPSPVALPPVSPPYEIPAWPPRPAAKIVQSDFLRAAIYGGAVGTLLSALPLGFLIGLPLAGVLAVRLYRRQTYTRQLSQQQGFRLGALAGLFAFVMLVVVRSVTIALFGGGDELRQAMIDGIHRAQTANPDPQAQQFLQYFLTPQGMAVMAAFGLIFMCVVFVLLAGLGGLFASRTARKPQS